MGKIGCRRKNDNGIQSAYDNGLNLFAVCIPTDPRKRFTLLPLINILLYIFFYSFVTFPLTRALRDHLVSYCITSKSARPVLQLDGFYKRFCNTPSFRNETKKTIVN